MKNAIITVDMSPKIALLLNATRIHSCAAFDCVNNHYGECQLKQVRILEKGDCSGYIKKVDA